MFSTRWMVTAIALTSLYGSQALACKCIGQPADARVGVTKALKAVDMVFVGRIESKEKFSGEDRGYTVEFERTQFYVVQSWKGEKASRVFVESRITCCVCGIAFPDRGSYLVYAYGPEANGYYTTDTCTRTKPLEEATEEIKLLDEIVAETKQTSNPSPPAPKVE